jgi:hypothetical protein
MYQLLYTFLSTFFMMTSKDTTTTHVSDRETQSGQNTPNSDYYAFHRIPVIVQGGEIGKVFADVKDNLIVIAGENKKEHEYLIPKSKVSRYNDKQVYLSISDSFLKEIEV